MRATVTQQIIDSAIQRDPSYCALAIAIRHDNPHLGWVKVDRNYIRFSNKLTRQRHIIHTPMREQRFVDRFDVDKNLVTPIRLVINEDMAFTVPMKTGNAVVPSGRPRKPKPTKKSRPKRALVGSVPRLPVKGMNK